MCPVKDLGDLLVEEVLTDVATTFLGERKEIEDQIRLLGTFMEELSAKSRELQKRISVLNYLLLNTTYAREFYQAIAVSPDEFTAVKPEIRTEILPGMLPSAIRMNKRYFRLVLLIYEKLQQQIADYLGGNEDYDLFSNEKKGRNIGVNQTMVVHMVELINEKITRINTQKSPSTVLQFAKSLNTETLEKERVTGAMSSDYEESLNKKLALKTINMNSLQIKTYPRLPETEAVRSDIRSYCTMRYKSDKQDIRRLMGAVASMMPREG